MSPVHMGGVTPSDPIGSAISCMMGAAKPGDPFLSPWEPSIRKICAPKNNIVNPALPNIIKVQPLFGHHPAQPQAAPRSANNYRRFNSYLDQGGIDDYDLKKGQPSDFYDASGGEGSNWGGENYWHSNCYVPPRYDNGRGDRARGGFFNRGYRGGGGAYDGWGAHSEGGAAPGYNRAETYRMKREEKESHYRAEKERRKKAKREVQDKERLDRLMKEMQMAVEVLAAEKERVRLDESASGGKASDGLRSRPCEPANGDRGNDAATGAKGCGMQNFKIPKKKPLLPTPITPALTQEIVSPERSPTPVKYEAVSLPGDSAASSKEAVDPPEKDVVAPKRDAETLKEAAEPPKEMNPVSPQPKEAPKVAPESERKAEAPQEAAPASAAAVASSVADCKKALKDGDPVKVEIAQQTDHVKPVLKLTDKDQIILMLAKILTGDDLAGDGSGDPIVMVGKKMRKTSPKRTVIGMKKNNSEKNTKKSKDLAKMLQAAVKAAMKRSDPYEGETDAENPPAEESEDVEPVTTRKMERRGDLKTLQADIRDLFISSGVLTATEKGLCNQMQPPSEEDKDPDKNVVVVLAAAVDDERLTRSRKKEALPAEAKMKQIKGVMEKANLCKVSKTFEAPPKPAAKRSRKTEDSTTTDSSESVSSASRVTRKKLFPAPAAAKRQRMSRQDKQELKAASKKDAESDATSSCTESKLTFSSAYESGLELSPLRTYKLNPPKFAAKRKRRMNAWSKGYIRKKKRARESPLTEDDSVFMSSFASMGDASESDDNSLASPAKEAPSSKKQSFHDKSYFLDLSAKRTRCNLCPFAGKQIAQHCKLGHDDCEMLVSRWSPEATADVIREAELEEYEDVLAEEMFDERTARKTRFTYRCRFCELVFKDELSQTFYDHLSAHTGEFRFNCIFCSYKTAVLNSLKGHVAQMHNGRNEFLASYEPPYPYPPNFTVVFGYVCEQCNFVQLERGNVVKHVAANHRDEADVRIVKVNMSAAVCDIEDASAETGDEGTPKKAKAAAEDEAMEQEDAKPLSKLKRAKKGTPTIRKSINKSKEEAAEVKKKELKMEVPEVEETPQAEVDEAATSEPAPKKEKSDVAKAKATTKALKERDANVFECPAVYMENEKRIEAERMKRMKEICDDLKPWRKNPSNIVEQIKNRWESKATETAAADEEKEVKKVSAAKPLKAKAVPEAGKKIRPTATVAESPLPAKLNARAMSVFEKLKKRIEDFKPIDDPVSLTVGPITVVKKDGLVQSYVCNINVCVFATDRAEVFLTHCWRTHREYLWSGACPECRVAVDGYPMGATMFQTFQHIARHHLPVDVRSGLEEKLKAVDLEHGRPFEVGAEASAPCKGEVRVRRFSRDNFSSRLPLDKEDEAMDEEDVAKDDFEAIQEEIMLADVSLDHQRRLNDEDGLEPFFPFSIANVRTIMENELKKLGDFEQVDYAVPPLIHFNTFVPHEVNIISKPIVKTVSKPVLNQILPKSAVGAKEASAPKAYIINR